MNFLNRIVPRAVQPLWAAANVSLIGDSLHDVAIMWLIYDLTGSPSATGALGVARYLPSILIGIFAGAWVDRVSRESVLLWCDAIRILLVGLIAGFVAVNSIGPLGLYVLAFAVSVCTVFFAPARDALVPQLVSASELNRATSALQSSLGVAYFVGPLLAAVMLPIVGLAGLFGLDALTYAISFLFLLSLKRGTKIQAAAEPPLRMVKEGLAYARQSGLVHGLLWVTAVDNFFIMGLAIVGTPIYVRNHLELGAEAYAVLQSCFALGIVAGSILVHRFGSRLPRGKTLLFAIVFDGISFMPLYFADTLFTAAIIWFIHSIGIPFILIPRTSLVQTEVTSYMQGRVFSLVQLTVVGLSALSSGVVGIVLTYTPPEDLYLYFGLAAGIVGAVGFTNKSLRSLR
ncbi:MFS transporter [bacterium]|nr:MFS transporter [bacterium]